MQKQFGGTLAVVFGLAAAGWAGPGAVKGDPVRITGCVQAGTSDRSVVLTHVAEGMSTAASDIWLGAEGLDAPSTTNGIVYWLDHGSVKNVREHMGHRVEITGTITDITSGTLKVDKDPGKSGADNKVEIDKGNKSAKLKTDADVGGTPNGTETHQRTPVTVHRIKVGTVTTVSKTCP